MLTTLPMPHCGGAKGDNEVAQPSQSEANGPLLSEAIDVLRVFVARWEDLFDRDAGDGETWQSSELSDALERAEAVISKAEAAGAVRPATPVAP
jgi:hypothetical protein